MIRLETINRGLINDIEQLKRNNQDINGLARTIAEYEQKVAIAFEENERVQSALRAKTDALANAEIRLRNLSL